MNRRYFPQLLKMAISVEPVYFVRDLERIGFFKIFVGLVQGLSDPSWDGILRKSARIG